MKTTALSCPARLWGPRGGRQGWRGEERAEDAGVGRSRETSPRTKLSSCNTLGEGWHSLLQTGQGGPDRNPHSSLNLSGLNVYVGQANRFLSFLSMFTENRAHSAGFFCCGYTRKQAKAVCAWPPGWLARQTQRVKLTPWKARAAKSTNCSCETPRRRLPWPRSGTGFPGGRAGAGCRKLRRREESLGLLSPTPWAVPVTQQGRNRSWR